MFVAMNRFQVSPGKEEDFEAVWAGRDSHLAGVPGFTSFHLLRADTDDARTLYATHTVWDSEQAFRDWTKSEAFRAAHAGAGKTRDLYAGPPSLELFGAVAAVSPG